jgi:hypothetical protein
LTSAPGPAPGRISREPFFPTAWWGARTSCAARPAAIAQVIGNTRLIASQLLLHNATNATDYTAAAAVRRRRAVRVCVCA